LSSKLQASLLQPQPMDGQPIRGSGSTLALIRQNIVEVL